MKRHARFPFGAALAAAAMFVLLDSTRPALADCKLVPARNQPSAEQLAATSVAELAQTVADTSPDCLREFAAGVLDPVLPQMQAKLNVPKPSAGRQSGDKGALPKRVWTNEDFADTAKAPASQQDHAKAESAKQEPQRDAPEDSAELQQARQQVLDEMVSTAKIRQKAYDDTIDGVRAKLKSETNPFRIEVYNNILRDTLRLKQINSRVLEQFGAEPESKTAQDRVADAQQAFAGEVAGER